MTEGTGLGREEGGVLRAGGLAQRPPPAESAALGGVGGLAGGGGGQEEGEGQGAGGQGRAGIVVDPGVWGAGDGPSPWRVPSRPLVPASPKMINATRRSRRSVDCGSDQHTGERT